MTDHIRFRDGRLSLGKREESGCGQGINAGLSFWIYFCMVGLIKVSIVPYAYADFSELTDVSVLGDRAISPGVLNLSQTDDSDNLTEIINVQIEATEIGLDVVLGTATGELPLPAPTIDGNSLVADIPNARLALPSGQAFQADDPVTGIANVSVTQLSDDQVRIRVVGAETAPVGTVRFQDDRFVLSVQATPAVADASDEAIRITVTAEKTPEDPLDVPISLTVLTEDELVDGQINTIAEVAANTPNFYFTPGDRVFNLYSVRGLGNSSNVLIRDSVSFYIDDVPYDNVHQFFPGELFDLERVEILRGPQSTLYGRNSQAGVVNIISRAPSEVPEVRASALGGSFGERQIQASWSDNLIPDTLGVRLAGIYRANDGFTDNTLLDNDADEQSGAAGRLNLLWTPSDRWNVSFNAALSSNNDDASVYVPIDQDDPFEIARSDNGEFDLDINTQSLRVGYEGDSAQFTSITSRSGTDYSYFDVNDDFGTITISDYEQEIFNQEFRLQSPATADQFQWIAGAFFQNRDFRIGDDLEFLFLGTDIGESNYDQTTVAGFAQIDYEPIESLTLTAGLRYEYWQEELNRDAQTFRFTDGTVVPSLFFPFSEINDSDINGDVWLPRFALNYRVNPNVGVYGSIARGYRPGTHNYLAFTDEELIVEPEQSWNYEVGLKTSWFDDRLGINLAAFYNDISDFQVLVLDDSLIFADISNAEARAIGAELEIRATPFDGFDIIAGLGYTDAEFTDNTNPFTGENFDGNRLLYSPDYTYNIAMQYRSPNGFFGRLEVQGVGTVFFDEANEIEEEPFTLVNTRIGYEFENVGIYLFANNLFNTEYVSLAFPGFAGDILAGYGDRRTFGIEVRSQF